MTTTIVQLVKGVPNVPDMNTAGNSQVLPAALLMYPEGWLYSAFSPNISSKSFQPVANKKQDRLDIVITE